MLVIQLAGHKFLRLNILLQTLFAHFSPGYDVFMEIKDSKVGQPALALLAWMPALLWTPLSLSSQSNICFVPILV